MLIYFYDAYVKRQWDITTFIAVKFLVIVLVTGKPDDGLKISGN